MRKFAFTYLFSFLFLISLTTFGSTVHASEAALTALFDALKGRGFSVSHRNLQGAGDSATFDELRLSNGKENAPEVVFIAGRVVKAQSTDGVGLSGETFAVRELRLENKGQAVIFERLQVQDFSMPHMELLLDVGAPATEAEAKADPLGALSGTFYKFLAGSNFSLFSVDSAKTDLLVNGQKGTIKTGPLALEALQNGKLASYALNKIVYSLAPVGGKETKFSIDKILVNDYNIATLAHVLDAENYKNGQGDGVWRDAAGVGTITNMEMLIEGGTVKVSKMTTGASRLRQLDIPPIEAVKVIQGAAEAQKTGANPIEAFSKLAPTMSSFYRMMEMDEIRVEGIVVAPPKNQPPFELGTVLVDRYSIDEGLKEVSIADLSFADKNGVAVKLGRFALGDIQFPALAGITEFLNGLNSGTPPKPSYAAVAAFAPTLGAIDIKGFAGDFKEDGAFSLDGATLTATDYIRLVPTKLSLKLDNVVAPLEGLGPNNDVAEILVKLGYKQAVLNGTVDMAWNEATQELQILPSQVTVNDMGILNLSATVGGVPRQFIEDPEKGAAYAAGMTFNEASISFEDKSITNRFVEMTAKNAGGDAAAVRKQFGAVARGPLAILQKPDFADQVGLVVDNFLANPGTLTITAKPPQPMPIVGIALMSKQSPGALVDALNVQIAGP